MLVLLLDDGAPVVPAPPMAGDIGGLNYDPSHVAVGLGRFIEQYKGKPRINALAETYLEQIQELEDTLWDLATLRAVATAEGTQLDGLGEIVGQERQGLSDDDYRPLIRARIQANKSDGTVLDLYRVVIAAYGAAGNVEVRQVYPAAVEVYNLSQLTFDPSILNDLLQDAVAGGVRLVTISVIDELSQSAIFSAAADYPTVSTYQGLGSASVGGTGTGALSSAMDETS